MDESLKSCVVDKFVACAAGLSGGVRTVECFFAVRTGFSQRNPVSSDRIDTGRRDWHRLEDGNRGFWGTRCRQVVSIPLDGVNAAERCRYLGEQGLRTRPWFAVALWQGLARGLDAEAGHRTSATPKYGHLLPTCRPRATMAA